MQICSIQAKISYGLICNPLNTVHYERHKNICEKEYDKDGKFYAFALMSLQYCAILRPMICLQLWLGQCSLYYFLHDLTTGEATLQGRVRLDPIVILLCIGNGFN